MKEGPNWTNGVIRRFDKIKRVGLIRQYDGEDVVFQAKNVEREEDEELLEEGRMVIYSAEETDIGVQARHINPLDKKTEFMPEAFDEEEEE